MPNTFNIQNATLFFGKPEVAQEAPQPLRFGSLILDAVREAGGLNKSIGLDEESGLASADPLTLQRLIQINAEWLQLSGSGDFDTKKTLVRTYAARVIACAIAAVVQADAEDTVLHKD